MYAKILSAYSPSTAKYFLCILCNSFITLAYSQNTQKEWRLENREKEIFLSTMPDEIKGAVFRENQKGIINWPTVNKLQIYGYLYLKKCSLRRWNIRYTVKKARKIDLSLQILDKAKNFEIIVLYPSLNDQKNHLTLLSL